MCEVRENVRVEMFYMYTTKNIFLGIPTIDITKWITGHNLKNRVSHN